MIPKVNRGKNSYGLVRYLILESEEHKDARLVAACPEVEAEVQAPELCGEHIAPLGRLLDEVRKAHGLPAEESIWHCSLAIPPQDGILPDERWAEAARELVERMGFADCRWLAIRHGESKDGNDHVHVVVNRARPNGRLASVHRDYPRSQAVCRDLEKRWGLTEVKGKSRGYGRGEREHDNDRGRDGQLRGSRDTLERVIRAAAQSSRDELEFTQRLRAQEVALKPRYDQSGRVVGASYRLPRQVGSKQAEPWYGGGKLGRDLTLPALRRFWGQDEDAPRRALRGWSGIDVPADVIAAEDAHYRQMWTTANGTIDRARDALKDRNPTRRAYVLREAAGTAAALSLALEGDRPGRLARAVKTMQREADYAERQAQFIAKKNERRFLFGLAYALGAGNRKRGELERIGNAVLSLTYLNHVKNKRERDQLVEQRRRVYVPKPEPKTKIGRWWRLGSFEGR